MDSRAADANAMEEGAQDGGAHDGGALHGDLHSGAVAQRAIARATVVGRLALYTLSLFLIFSSAACLTTALWLGSPLALHEWFMRVHQIVCTMTLGLGAVLFVILFAVHRLIVPPRDFFYRPLDGARVHVGLTAYEDEGCIGDAVRDFKASPDVHKVIVVDNNSRDGTARAAAEAGADEVVIEKIPGYGSCCMRALAEAARGADVIVLCEGDMTFCGRDVKKLLAYLENADMVLGTRATQELRNSNTQMDWLINPGNQVVAKLIQTRFWGTRLTDVGCTYRALHADAYDRLHNRLRERGNAFSPHMFIEALKMRMRLLEVPVTFRQRAGVSKGVGNNRVKAARVALRMLSLLYRA